MILYVGPKHKIPIKLPGTKEQIERFLRCLIVTLTVAAVILGAICLFLLLRQKDHTLELGQPLTAEELLGAGAVFGDDYDPSCIKTVGTYYFTVIKDGKERSVKLKVKDTKPPEIVLKEIKCALGAPSPTPEDFIDTVDEASDFRGEFITPLPEMKAFAEYGAEVRFTDAEGNRTEVLDVKVTLIYDNTLPEIKPLSKEVLYDGGMINYLDHVSLSDDCCGALTLTADESNVDPDKPGKYQVILIAKDAVGNQSKPFKLTVVVPAPDETDAG